MRTLSDDDRDVLTALVIQTAQDQTKNQILELVNLIELDDDGLAVALSRQRDLMVQELNEAIRKAKANLLRLSG